MKDLYLKILAKFAAEVPEFLWVDKDKGQLDNFNVRPQLAFPAALIRFDIIDTDDLGHKIQNVTLQVAFRLAFGYTGETSGRLSQEDRERSLAYFDNVQKVFEAFQGWEEDTFNEWVRTGQVEEQRGDGLQVTSMIFKTEYRDDSAQI